MWADASRAKIASERDAIVADFDLRKQVARRQMQQRQELDHLANMFSNTLPKQAILSNVHAPCNLDAPCTGSCVRGHDPNVFNEERRLREAEPDGCVTSQDKRSSPASG